MATVSKSPVSRVQAQTSTRQGAQTWLLERATSVALLPLSLWFILAAVGQVKKVEKMFAVRLEFF